MTFEHPDIVGRLAVCVASADVVSDWLCLLLPRYWPLILGAPTAVLRYVALEPELWNTSSVLLLS